MSDSRAYTLMSATPMACGETRNTSQIRGSSGTNREVIAEHRASSSVAEKSGLGVQSCRYRPVNPDRAIAFRLLRGVPMPLTVLRAARALQWRRERAQKWIHEAEAKGELVKVAVGWAWRDG